jgi:hypothetical protein
MVGMQIDKARANQQSAGIYDQGSLGPGDICGHFGYPAPAYSEVHKLVYLISGIDDPPPFDQEIVKGCGGVGRYIRCFVHWLFGSKS